MAAGATHKHTLMLEVRQYPGRGRGLATIRDVRAGETLITEEPILLTVAQDAKNTACAHCLRHIPGPAAGQLACGLCSQVVFCSGLCQQEAAAKPWVHAPATCRAYSLLAQHAGDAEAASALRFLIQVAALKSLGASDPEQRYQKLLGLDGEADETSTRQATALHQALCAAIGDTTCSLLSIAESAALLRKEQCNSYGITGPKGPDGEDHVRGGGLYAHCALVNHECAPNAARFDAFDAHEGSQGSTAVSLRALQNLPAGTEVTISYMPMYWDYPSRQEHAKEVYGFVCRCARCQTEAEYDWGAEAAGSDEEWATDDGEGDDAMQEDNSALDAAQCCAGGLTSAFGPVGPQQPQQSQRKQDGDGPLDPTYLQLFLLKYLCAVESCLGTLAPVGPGADVYECNVCGGRRTEAEFLAELERSSQ